LAAESLKEIISSERKAIKESSYSVCGILNSSNPGYTSRSENLKELLDDNEKYVVYKFNLRLETLAWILHLTLFAWRTL